jgi:hypothetical protein
MKSSGHLLKPREKHKFFFGRASPTDDRKGERKMDQKRDQAFQTKAASYEGRRSRRGVFTWLRRQRFFPYLAGAFIAVLLMAAVAVGLRSVFTTDGKSTKLGFEDIGELATQSAYCTEVEVAEDSRELFGISIPFTQSKYIYSYDVLIKAGLDFTAVTWSEQNGIISVSLPEIKILSSEIDLDSLKVYHEDESIFQQITLEENNKALIELKERAESNAIANGLLDLARENAEQVLTGFFANQYDLNEYQLQFVNQ